MKTQNQYVSEFKHLFRDHYGVLFSIILPVIILYFYSQQPGLSTDGTVYLQIARNLLQAKELGWQASMFLPLHSILIAGVSYLFNVKDLLSVASIVSHSMFLLLVPAVYLLALEMFEKRTAIVAAIATATFPHLIAISNSPEPEITYTVFLVISFLLFAITIRKNSYLFAGMTGLSFALAYLSRSEAFIVMCSIFMFTTAVQGMRFYKTMVFRFCLVSVLFFCVAVAPYVLKLEKDYGQLVLHPKATNVMQILRWRIPHDRGSEVSYSDLWQMDESGRFLWQKPAGMGDVIKLFASYPRESLSYYAKSFLRQIPGMIPNGSGMEKLPQVFPVYIVIAAFFAFWGGREKVSKEKKCILLAPFLIMFTLPLLGGWWKYMVPYVPVLIILASHGLVNISEMLSNRFAHGNIVDAGKIFMVVAILAIVARFNFAMSLQKSFVPSERNLQRLSYGEELKRVGAWVSKRFAPGKNYMLQWSKLVYYLNGQWTPDPFAEHSAILNFAKKNKVDYIVKEITDPALSLEDIKDAPPGIEFVDVYLSERGNYKVAFYKLKTD